MENFEGIFIATTNLMDNLDKASLRRFDLKLEFNSLKPEQAWKMFEEFAKKLKLSKVDKILQKDIISLNNLTPGDFAAVVRQNRFHPIESVDDFLVRLQDEVKVKHMDNSSKMGFIQ